MKLLLLITLLALPAVTKTYEPFDCGATGSGYYETETVGAQKTVALVTTDGAVLARIQNVSQFMMRGGGWNNLYRANVTVFFETTQTGYTLQLNAANTATLFNGTGTAINLPDMTNPNLTLSIAPGAGFTTITVNDGGIITTANTCGAYSTKLADAGTFLQ